MALAAPPAERQPAISPGVSLHLDALRGASAIVVLLTHFSEIVLNPKLGPGPLSRGAGLLASYAVMVFFALSGFMIAASIWRNVKRNGGDFHARRFASDRFFRLYPPLIAALAICALAAAAHRLIAGSASANLLLPGNLQAARGAIVFDPAEAGLTLVQAQGLDPRIAMDMDGPLWSLGYEFWFYVLAGLTALAILRRGVTPAVGIVALMAAPLVADNARFYGFLIIWCLGAVWFVALTSGIDAARLARWALIAAAGFVLAAAAALVVGGPRVANPHYTGAEFVFQTAVVGLGSIALAAYLRRSTARAPRTVRAVASTAAYSYTLYVVHFPLLLVLFAFANPFLAPRSILYSILFSIIVAPIILLASRQIALVAEDRRRWQRLGERVLTRPRTRAAEKRPLPRAE